MKKKQVFLGILLFLIAIIISAFVSAACGTLNSDYTLTGNETTGGNCFLINANGITLNCAGYSINGANTGTGIKMNGRNNVVIKNCDIRNFSTGVNISNSNLITVNNTNISYSTNGMSIDPTSNTRVTGGKFTQCSNICLDLPSSQNGTFEELTFNSCSTGISIGAASSNNAFIRTKVSGSSIADFENSGSGTTFTDVTCADGTEGCHQPNSPWYSDFTGSTTNFGSSIAVPDLGRVASATISNGVASIVYDYTLLDARNANLNDNIKMGNNFVSVNPAGLHSSFDNMAYITLAVPDCNHYVLYQSPLFSSSAAEIKASGSVCNTVVCSSRSCLNNVAHFIVDGFSGYASGLDTNLTIWDDTDTQTKYTNQQVNFFANYTNATSGAPITGANCNITFQLAPTGPFTMTYNAGSTLYEYNRTFASVGAFNWDVNCSATGYANLKATDTVTISSSPGSVPEFSTYAMLLALMIVISGFFIYRNKLK